MSNNAFSPEYSHNCKCEIDFTQEINIQKVILSAVHFKHSIV